MKYLIIFICVFLFSINPIIKRRNIPPGTVEIYENFFADETEVTNLSWLEYEHWTTRKYGPFSPEHLAVIPDTLVWQNGKQSSEYFVKSYYRLPYYHNYPVVGITYEQATAFCKWRTERVRESGYIRYKKDLKFSYRLPSLGEWELISESSWHNLTRDTKGRMVFNLLRENTLKSDDILSPPADITAPVYSYLKNRFGLYNSIGNVSEMVLEKGISKGGSWKHKLEECRIGKNILYDKASSWLGFRCVCEIK